MSKIRNYQAEDAADVARLVTGLGYPVGTEEIRARLASLSADHHALVAELEGEVVGFIGMVSLAVYEHVSPLGYILALSVAPEHQGKGIGKALLRAAEEHLRDRGCGDVRVSSGLQREEAHRFYEAAGYAKTGYRFRKVLAEDG
jgi:ribosomal protein S18 acetylase RimI-like enzyme